MPVTVNIGRVARVSTEFAHRQSGYDLVFRARHLDGYHVIHALGKWQTMADGTELALLTYSDLTANFDAMTGSSENYNLFRQDQFYTDSLTGLPNLNYLNQFAEERVHAFRTAGKTPVLIYADVISMHYYNSQYGHEKGNELLKLIADKLKEEIPDALIHTLAEGMETEAHRKFLMDIGCELAQGYFFHRPEPLEATFYRLDNGEKPRPVETAAERDILSREWVKDHEGS